MRKQQRLHFRFNLIVLLLLAGRAFAADGARCVPSENPAQPPTWLEYVRTGVRPGMIRDIAPGSCALVVVDIQDATMTDVALKHPSHTDAQRRVHRKRMHELVLPNINRLIRFFRAHDIPVVYICLGDETPHKALVQPRPEEKVLNKPRTGAFAATDLHQYLQRIGTDTLFITGTDTGACAMITAFGACNLGYQVIVVDDACLSVTPEGHENAIELYGLFATVQTTCHVLSDYPWASWIDRSDPTPAAMKQAIEENIMAQPDKWFQLDSFRYCTQTLLSNYSLGKISEDEFTKLWYGLDSISKRYYYEDFTQKMQEAVFRAKWSFP